MYKLNTIDPYLVIPILGKLLPLFYLGFAVARLSIIIALTAFLWSSAVSSFRPIISVTVR